MMSLLPLVPGQVVRVRSSRGRRLPGVFTLSKRIDGGWRVVAPGERIVAVPDDRIEAQR